MMDFEGYVEKAWRTANTNQPHGQALAIWALGLEGESIEYMEIMPKADRCKSIKELGDVMWYVAAIYKQINLNTPVLDVPSNQNTDASVKTLVLAAKDTGEMIKKHVGHGHELDRLTIIKALQRVVQCVGEAAKSHGSSLEEVMQRNVEKLETRYKQGVFTSKESIDRAEDC